MSRALNIDATLDAVVAMSAKHNAAISAIEPLLPRGTRVVFMNADGAAVVARAYGSKVMAGAVTREPWKQRSPDV
jgi:ABC-type sugar transport system substrate-binding protein